MPQAIHKSSLALIAGALSFAACTPAATRSSSSAAPKVGSPAGTVIVVGGGVVGPEIVSRFIEASGGPDALIVDVPTAGGDTAYPANWRGANFLRAGGAKNIVILHTSSRSTADTPEFAQVLKKAGGVWFEGGRQWHLVDSYAGTRTEQGFHDILARGGVMAGTSAGASILSSYMLRGARAGNETVMAPGYEVGFGFLRGVAIDQHVVARERLRDLADSLLPKRPDLLGISEDEGTAWVVHGDVAEIIGRNKAFVYGGADRTDMRKPFLTLYPGDRYDLGARHVTHRAVDDSPVSLAFVDSLFQHVNGKATVLVAQNGKVLIDQAYNIPDHPRYLPGTTVPNFALGELSAPINALVTQIATPADAKRFAKGYPATVSRRLFTPIGAHKTTVDSTGAFASNVDELYRLELGLENAKAFANDTVPALRSLARIGDLGWSTDTYRGQVRLSAYANASGHRNAFIRVPDRTLVAIILSDDDQLDARAIASKILDRLIQ